MMSSCTTSAGAIAPFVPPTNTTSVNPTNEFYAAWTPQECYQWINRNMNQGLLVADSGIYTAENDAVLEPMNLNRDFTPLMKKNMCTYETTGNNPQKTKKTRFLHANRVFYKNQTGDEIDSGICRAQTPEYIKRFYSWLIYKGQQEQRVQHIFNLVHTKDQNNELYNMYYHPQGVTCDGKRPLKSYVEVDTTRYQLNLSGDDYSYFDFKVKKYLKPNANSGFSQAAEQIVKLSHYHSWSDGRIIDLEKLDALVMKVIEAKKANESPIIHCLAGKGRTGTLITAVILKEEIAGQNTLGITKDNYKYKICQLVVDLRNNGGGSLFVSNRNQLELLFKYAEKLLGIV